MSRLKGVVRKEYPPMDKPSSFWWGPDRFSQVIEGGARVGRAHATLEVTAALGVRGGCRGGAGGLAGPPVRARSPAVPPHAQRDRRRAHAGSLQQLLAAQPGLVQRWGEGCAGRRLAGASGERAGAQGRGRSPPRRGGVRGKQGPWPTSFPVPPGHRRVEQPPRPSSLRRAAQATAAGPSCSMSKPRATPWRGAPATTASAASCRGASDGARHGRAAGGMPRRPPPKRLVLGRGAGCHPIWPAARAARGLIYASPPAAPVPHTPHPTAPEPYLPASFSSARRSGLPGRYGVYTALPYLRPWWQAQLDSVRAAAWRRLRAPLLAAGPGGPLPLRHAVVRAVGGALAAGDAVHGALPTCLALALAAHPPTAHPPPGSTPFPQTRNPCDPIPTRPTCVSTVAAGEKPVALYGCPDASVAVDAPDAAAAYAACCAECSARAAAGPPGGGPGGCRAFSVSLGLPAAGRAPSKTRRDLICFNSSPAPASPPRSGPPPEGKAWCDVFAGAVPHAACKGTAKAPGAVTSCGKTPLGSGRIVWRPLPEAAP
jgi:hypothetical protein